MATRVRSELLTVEEFLGIDFGPDLKAELDNGVIRMMAGGTAAHARVSRNTLSALVSRLRGSGCSPYGSDMGIKTHGMSLRYPDVSVFCGRDTIENDHVRIFDDPKVLFEVLSESTAHHDLNVKLREYQALPSTDVVLLIDPHAETALIFSRNGRQWDDALLTGNATIELPTLGVRLPLHEVFARD